VRPLELWAGVECTLNRVGDRYFDQLEWSGHRDNADDLDLIGALGVRTVRYPVLWERAPDWDWADARLHRLRELGIRPIVGLVHHGSGPPHTSLLDDGFAEGLAEHAAAVAERYPWVEDWTPVNEPLTTARFSALYGHWYPHAADDRSFAAALLNQCRATTLAMRAIRRSVPEARLLQTDDVGYAHATEPLRDQAAFENERRWASFDLLTGTLDPDGRFGRWLRDVGIGDEELAWFREHPCPPQIVGVNHYLSSERLLDHRLERHDACWHGGNGRERYADVHAPAELRRGLAAVLREAWERYRLPLAVTEAHNAVHREEQLRWLLELWSAAEQVQAEGADVRAVTVWSLLGTFGWERLCTAGRGDYEAGVYDIRGGGRRATALAGAVRSLAAGGPPASPVLADRGWWRRDRLPLRGRPVLITGATGTLGRAFAQAATQRNLAHRLLDRVALDIAEPSSVAAALDELHPWAVINAAGYVRVDAAESDPGRCLRENRDGPALLAAACATRRLQLVTFSSDLVFDGAASLPYVESDAVAPLNVYGRSKASGEELVLARWPHSLVVRTSAFFGPHDPHNFATLAVERVRGGGSFEADAETTISPTYVPDLVHATLDLLVDGESGLWHLANEGAVTWFEFACRAAAAARADERLVVAAPAQPLPAARPRYSALSSERGRLLPPLDNALHRYAAAISTP
jgi:dTDP-4-dehydrorhamnose reductase